MSFGHIVTILLKIVTVYTGVALAVRPYPMRWENRWVKGIFAVLMVIAVASRVGNTFWAKSSAPEIIIEAFYLFVVFLIFFKINIWQLLVRNFLYWCHLLMLEHFVVYLICFVERVTFADYNVNYIEERFLPWSGWHILIEIVMIAGLLVVAWWMRGRSFIRCRRKRTYKYLAIFLLLEWLFFENIIYTREYVYQLTERVYILFLLFFLLVLMSAGIVCMLLNAYNEVKQQEKMEAMNSRMMSEQYKSLCAMYEAKRRQFHDMRHHLVTVDGFLKDGAPEAARAYVEEQLDVSMSSKCQNYTGVPVIDFMLNYKVAQAKEQGIEVNLFLNVHTCPVKDSDFCVVLGNLLDNAIEAVSVLEAPRRCIKVSMKMARNIFVLEISNPYEGKRRKTEGRYETTKADRASHGLGLASVRNIVEGAEGLMDIHDDGKLFVVVVSLFT